jgi:hypothetical protein
MDFPMFNSTDIIQFGFSMNNLWLFYTEHMFETSQ